MLQTIAIKRGTLKPKPSIFISNTCIRNFHLNIFYFFFPSNLQKSFGIDQDTALVTFGKLLK